VPSAAREDAATFANDPAAVESEIQRQFGDAAPP
jgi:hypothetical protein